LLDHLKDEVFAWEIRVGQDRFERDGLAGFCTITLTADVLVKPLYSEIINFFLNLE